MPQLPMNYKNGVIYKICCNDVTITDVYVGSTTNFIKRKSAHKHACTKEGNRIHNLNVYQFIRSNGGWSNWSVIVVEEFPCDSKNQLLTRERYNTELLNSSLNKCIPSRTKKEYLKGYRKNNAEQIKAQLKEYYQINAEHIHAQKKAYSSEKIPCPHCNKMLSRCSMTRHTKSQHPS